MNAEAPTADEIREIHQRLAEAYGRYTWEPRTDPISELVNTILSQNTNDHNRDIAYEQLRERFPTWESVRDAPTDEIIDAVRPAGLAPSKAPRIQGALERIAEERGELSLDFLNELSLEEARSWLLSIKGVGPKTAAIVLLFALGRPAFPVDTHVHRVTQRLGLIPDSTSRKKAHHLLEDIVPQKLYYPFHIELIKHGREICAARRPRCGVCMLTDLCAYYTERSSDEEEKD
jgi:endonuclease-3